MDEKLDEKLLKKELFIQKWMKTFEKSLFSSLLEYELLCSARVDLNHRPLGPEPSALAPALLAVICVYLVEFIFL